MFAWTHMVNPFVTIYFVRPYNRAARRLFCFWMKPTVQPATRGRASYLTSNLSFVSPAELPDQAWDAGTVSRAEDGQLLLPQRQEDLQRGGVTLSLSLSQRATSARIVGNVVMEVLVKELLERASGERIQKATKITLFTYLQRKSPKHTGQAESWKEHSPLRECERLHPGDAERDGDDQVARQRAPVPKALLLGRRPVAHPLDADQQEAPQGAKRVKAIRRSYKEAVRSE
uniref:Uncharacterized protein n=1 Tax=Steinernema glaseri TaxID=37863 RepID=A0A1I7Z627_9BILA